MEYLYIDESGSMTSEHSESNPYFVMGIIHTQNPRKLKHLYTRFVRKHMEELRAADCKHNKMFSGEKFLELKGAAFTPDLKHEFRAYFCREETIDIFYIVVDNRKVRRNENLYGNTARAFNYFLCLAMKYLIKHNYLPDEEYLIQLDERNERPDLKHFLQAYLNTELRMNGILSHDLTVRYFDSAKNHIVQLADVFANLLYSHLMTQQYSEDIGEMRTSGCLKYVFRFPLS